MRYIVFGVGDECRLRYSREFIEKIECFVDNDPNKQGKMFLGKEIRHPDCLDEGNDFIIISTIFNYYEVKKQLEKRGFAEKKDFVWGPDWYGNDEIPSTYGCKSWMEQETTYDFSKGIWDQRINMLTNMIDEDIRTVMDLGAGSMSLKNYLPDKVKYYPVDYCKRFDNTIVVNFNEHEFPDMKVDCIVASGILEYVDDVDWFIARICNSCNSALVSYNGIERAGDFMIRQHLGWKNNYTIVDIIRSFLNHGFQPMMERICKTSDIIIRFDKKL